MAILRAAIIASQYIHDTSSSSEEKEYMILFQLDYPEKVTEYEREGSYDKAAALCYERWKNCPFDLPKLVAQVRRCGTRRI